MFMFVPSVKLTVGTEHFRATMEGITHPSKTFLGTQAIFHLFLELQKLPSLNSVLLK